MPWKTFVCSFFFLNSHAEWRENFRVGLICISLMAKDENNFIFLLAISLHLKCLLIFLQFIGLFTLFAFNVSVLLSACWIAGRDFLPFCCLFLQLVESPLLHQASQFGVILFANHYCSHSDFSLISIFIYYASQISRFLTWVLNKMIDKDLVSSTYMCIPSFSPYFFLS